MTIFTYSQARQNLSKILNLARKEGAVLIRRRDGSVFRLLPVTTKSSPLDVKGVKTKITTKEIINFVRKSRRK